MNPRHLNILIVILYSLAALSLLGIGSNREKLKKLHQQEQASTQEVQQEPATSNQAEERGLASREELQTRLMIWQIVALSLFAVASILLVQKDKLLKKSPTSKNNLRDNGQH